MGHIGKSFDSSYSGYMFTVSFSYLWKHTKVQSDMKYGISKTALSAIRIGPDHRSEMLNQLLFGERFFIKQIIGSWMEIESEMLSGWVDSLSITILDKKEFEESRNIQRVNQLLKVVRGKDEHQLLYLQPGSELPNFDQETNGFFLEGESYRLMDSLKTQTDLNRETLKESILQYLNAPYLWGGRSLFGIDGPGLVQNAYKSIGIRLPGELDILVKLGTLVPFQKDAQSGDIAFFEDSNGIINHVGLMIDHTHIVHASGLVRIDALDQQGIRLTEEGQYAHKLRLIKSMI